MHVTVHDGQAASAIVQAPGNDLNGHGGSGFDMSAEQGGIEIHSHRVDVMHHQVAKARPIFKHSEQDTIDEKIWNLIPMTDRVQALQREIVSIVGAFTGLFRPIEEGGAAALTNLLRLNVEYLL